MPTLPIGDTSLQDRRFRLYPKSEAKQMPMVAVVGKTDILAFDAVPDMLVQLGYESFTSMQRMGDVGGQGRYRRNSLYVGCDTGRRLRCNGTIADGHGVYVAQP